MNPRKAILFICVANSARSQLAEGLARRILGPDVEVRSAGSRPSAVNPFAVRALQEIGIDISHHESKSVESLDPGFLARLDFVITLCAEEVCPSMVSKAKRLHWALPDPAGQGGTDDEKLERFRRTRDEIRRRLPELTDGR